MPLTKQIVQIPFGGGLDQKTDPKQVMAGKLLELKNGQFTKQGEIRKRFGYDTLGGATAPAGLVAFQDELLMFDEPNIYTRDTVAGAWVSRGHAIAARATDRQVIRMSAAQQLYPDAAVFKGYELYVWEDSRGGCRASMIQTATGAVVMQDVAFGTGFATKPKVFAQPSQNRFLVFWIDGGAVQVSSIGPGGMSFAAPLSLVSDVHAASGLDVTTVTRVTFYVAYLAGGPSIKVFTTTGGVPIATATVEAVAAQAYNGGPSVLSVAADSTNVWVSWGTGTEIRAACQNAALSGSLKASSQVEATRVDAITGLVASGALDLFYEKHDASATKHRVKRGTQTTALVTSGVDWILGHGLAAKAVSILGSTYVVIAHGSTLQSGYFVVNASLSPPFVVAKSQPGVGGGLRAASGATLGGTLSEVTQDSTVNDFKFVFANGTKGRSRARQTRSFRSSG
jgi:hypothetical protein